MADAICFSIVIPAYNAAKTIVAAVNSCLSQSYPPAEVIIVNDGSKDDTENVISSHFAGKVKYIALNINAGASIARNEGIKAATGDYIAFHDADDICHKDKLLRIAQELERQPEISFIFHPVTLGSLAYDALSDRFSLQPYPFRKLLLRNPVGTPCIVITAQKKLYFNESMRHMEDYDYALRAAEQFGLYYLNAPLLQLQRPVLSSGGLSSARWAMRKGEIKAYYLLAKRQPKYFMLLPVLIAISLAKHIFKAAINIFNQTK